MKKITKKIVIAILAFAMLLATDATGVQAATLHSKGITVSNNQDNESLEEPLVEQPYDQVVGYGVSSYTTSTLTLSWQSLGNNDGYNIYRKCQYDSAYQKLGSVKNTQYTTMSFKDSSFVRGISFTYKLVAYRTDTTTGRQTESASATTTAKVALPTVTLSKVSRSGKKAVVTWKKINNVAGYEIYRKNSGGTFKKTKTIKNAGTVKWTSSNVSKTKTTKYKVRAFVKYTSKYVYSSFSEVKETYSASTEKIVKKIKALKKKFPDGKYWNHVGKSKYNSSTITSKPCRHSSLSDLDSCNHYNCPNGILGYQCYGFAWKMSDLIYGRSAKIKNFSSFSKCKMGDVIRYSGHSVIITEKHSDYVVVGECNYGNTCIIKWGRKVYKSDLNGALYSRRYR